MHSSPNRCRRRRAISLHFIWRAIIPATIKRLPKSQGVAFVRDFETVRHALALEGAATVLGPTSEAAHPPVSLQNFRPGPFVGTMAHRALGAPRTRVPGAATSAAILTQKEMQDGPQTVRRLQELREVLSDLPACATAFPSLVRSPCTTASIAPSGKSSTSTA